MALLHCLTQVRYARILLCWSKTNAFVIVIVTLIAIVTFSLGKLMAGLQLLGLNGLVVSMLEAWKLSLCLQA